MKPYLSFYHERGIDTLSFAIGPFHILDPNQAYAQMEMVLDAAFLSKYSNDAPKESDSIPDSIIFHHFSVGGFLYGQALRVLLEQPDRFANSQKKIVAQIFDSPPDFTGIAAGVSKSMGIGPPWETIIEKMLRGYLKLTTNTSGVGHRASSKAFHENFIQAPSLWFYR